MITSRHAVCVCVCVLRQCACTEQGELVKCNAEVFRMFNDLLDDKKYTALMQVCVCERVCERERARESETIWIRSFGPRVPN